MVFHFTKQAIVKLQIKEKINILQYLSTYPKYLGYKSVLYGKFYNINHSLKFEIQSCYFLQFIH